MPAYPSPSPSTPFPTLAFGSIGKSVTLLQQALNVGASQQPKLNPDGQFGSKTRNRVMEFQGQKNIASDGVVGPVTWGQLEPFLQQLTALIDQNALPASEEDAYRQRIVDVARSSFDVWGWGATGQPAADGSARIAAAHGYGPSVAGFRARQGGPALGMIYNMAGVGGSNCLAISSQSEQAYRLPDGHPDKRTLCNADIGSWCGIFTTYCLRAAGLSQANWDRVSHQDATYFSKLGYNEPVRKGDIGVYTYTKKMDAVYHHFLVVEDSAPGATVHSMDGNVGLPNENQTATTWWSVIAPRKYFRATLKTAVTTFLRPKFAALR
jgi:hypothetical protein